MDKPRWPLILSGRPPLTLNELFSGKSRWCQNTDARDKHGQEIPSIQAPEAASWCLTAGIRLVYGHNPPLQEEISKMLLGWVQEQREEGEPDDSIAGWNDEPNRTFKDIRKMIGELKI